MADLRKFIVASLASHPELKFKVDTITFDDDEARFTLKVHFKKEVKDLEQIAAVKNLDLNKTLQGYQLQGYESGRNKPYRLRRIKDGQEAFAGAALIEMSFMKKPKKQEELK